MALDKKEKAIELQGITKTFGSVVANDHINLEVRRGEILASIGELMVTSLPLILIVPSSG